MSDNESKDRWQRLRDFERVVRPVIVWMRENCHPDMKVIIDTTEAELNEGVIRVNTEDKLKL